MRFVDFLRTAVLLVGGSASALAAAAVVGASADDDLALIYVGVGWWAVAAAVGAWLGRRAEVSAGTGRMMASARSTTALPELEPGTILANRLWTLAVFTVTSGALAFLFPQVPATAVGFPLLAALAWRKQAAAVTAVEERDGVRFYVERTSAFKPTRLVRTPGFRKVGERIDDASEREPAR